MSSVPSTPGVDVSVVIGFKDWGVDRLRIAVQSLTDSFGDLRGEVIVSDYGSTSCDGLQEVVESLGAVYVYTSTDGLWSRSRALNAGFAVSSGRVLVSTDADMLFSPRSMELVGKRLIEDPEQALVLQCRDLPEGMGSEYVTQNGLDWERFSAASSLRPRWGMGGMMAVSRTAFLDVRGFDERMQIYGGEDLDFAQRVRRSGRRIVWVEDPDVRMYHMWHPSSRKQADSTALGRAAIEYNRELYLHDASLVRNTIEWLHAPTDVAPVVSVVIATRDRAALLVESVRSVLSQTVEDLEVLVVDDGSTDDTEQRMSEISDPRVRYLKSPGRGIAAARNFAADNSSGRYTVIHDDDDLMTPRRVEHHLRALRAGDAGTYGAWVDFDDATGDVAELNPGKPFSLEALLFSPRVFAHATLMVETELLRAVRYDERFASGSDYNLALRLARMGVSLRHTGEVHLVRRLHSAQVTTVDSARQQYAAQWTAASTLSVIPPEQQKALLAEVRALRPVDIGLSKAEAQDFVTPWLPDRLVRRDLHVTFRGPAMAAASEFELEDVRHVRDALHDRPDEALSGHIRDATWETWARLRAARALVRVVSAQRRGSGRVPGGSTLTTLDHCRTLADIALRAAPAGEYVLVATVGREVPLSKEATIGRWKFEDEHVLLTSRSTWEAESRSIDGPRQIAHFTHVVDGLVKDAREAHSQGSTAQPPAKPAGPAAKRPAPKSKGAPGTVGGKRRNPGPVKPRTGAGPTTGKGGNGSRRKARGTSPAREQQRPKQARKPATRIARLPRTLLLGTGLALLVFTVATILLGALLRASGAETMVVVITGIGWLLVLGTSAAVGAATFMLVRRSSARLLDAEGRRQAEGRRAERRIRRALHLQGRRAERSRRRRDKMLATRIKTLEGEVRASQAGFGTRLENALEAVERARADIAVVTSGMTELVARSDELAATVAKDGAHLREGLRQSAKMVEDTARVQWRRFESLLALQSLTQPTALAPSLSGWAIAPDVLARVVEELIRVRPRQVVECGSGSSTVWLGLVVRELGLDTRVVALEHDPEFARKTTDIVEAHGLQKICDVRLAPLTRLDDGEGSLWYDPAQVVDLDDIGLLLVDGPPGNTGSQARMPAIPVLADSLAPDCVVVLDDYSRQDEQEVAKRWREILQGWTFEELDAERGAALFRRGRSTRVRPVGETPRLVRGR